MVVGAAVVVGLEVVDDVVVASMSVVVAPSVVADRVAAVSVSGSWLPEKAPTTKKAITTQLTICKTIGRERKRTHPRFRACTATSRFVSARDHHDRLAAVAAESPSHRTGPTAAPTKTPRGRCGLAGEHWTPAPSPAALGHRRSGVRGPHGRWAALSVAPRGGAEAGLGRSGQPWSRGPQEQWARAVGARSSSASANPACCRARWAAP